MTQPVSNDMRAIDAYAGLETPGGTNTAGLSPDALLVYLSTRLGSLEDQINGYFAQQQRADQLRGLLNDMKVAIQSLNGQAQDMNAVQYGAEGVMNRLNDILGEIAAIDPNLATAIGNNLSATGFVMNDGSETQLGDDAYLPSEIEPSLEYLEGEIGNLNSASQLNMIHLQSLVRAHETAVSLGTNLVEAAGRTTQKIADRIGS
jgi:hypothetical protein